MRGADDEFDGHGCAVFDTHAVNQRLACRNREIIVFGNDHVAFGEELRNDVRVRRIRRFRAVLYERHADRLRRGKFGSRGAGGARGCAGAKQ